MALGIAVAVWAGALTGGLQKTEKLIINSYTATISGTQTLVISVTNQGASAMTVTQVLFNSLPVTMNLFTSGGSFVAASSQTGSTYTLASFGTVRGNAYKTLGPAPPAGGNAYKLASGATGTLQITPAKGGFTVFPGLSYPITMVTAAGNSYPSIVAWQ